MGTNNIVVNEEIVEKTEVITKTSSGKGLAIALGVGLVALIGIIAYKHIINRKAKAAKTNKELWGISKEKFDEDEDFIYNETASEETE
ncbi:MAG: hypothetical protein LBR74_00860 [Eubacterium sp.]|nr:hypothetical protein [Eubacterium sp.]